MLKIYQIRVCDMSERVPAFRLRCSSSANMKVKVSFGECDSEGFALQTRARILTEEIPQSCLIPSAL